MTATSHRRLSHRRARIRVLLQLRRAPGDVSPQGMRVLKNEAVRWLVDAFTHHIDRADGPDVLGRCVYDVGGLGSSCRRLAPQTLLQLLRSKSCESHGRRTHELACLQAIDRCRGTLW